MRRGNPIRLASIAVTSAMLLAGCSGGSQFGSPLSANSQQQNLSRASVPNAQIDSGPNSDKKITYVTAIGGTTVYGYPSVNPGNEPPACTVGPFVSLNGGIGVDQSGNLWVPDQGANPKTVTEYGPNCGPVKKVLTISGDTLPDNVAFDSIGHVYVANAVANSGGPGNILQFTGKRVTKTLTDPDISTPQGLAVDNRNNVWVSYRDPGSSGTFVAEFPKGAMPAKLFHNITLGFPGSLQFDRNQNMLALAPGVPAMYIYAPPYDQKEPTSQLPLQNAPTMCTLGHVEIKLYCTNGFFSKVDIYRYPAGTYLYSYDNGLSGLTPDGIAHEPAPRN